MPLDATRFLLTAILLGVFAGIFLWVQRKVTRYSKLPPGIMGWPYFGETARFYSEHPNSFFQSKKQRYGDVVKTRILGSSAVMLSSAEAVKSILVTNAQNFRTRFPVSKETLIGKSAIFFQHGDKHQNLRRKFQMFLNPEAIRRTFDKIQSLAIHTLSDMEGSTCNTFAQVKKFTFNVSFILAFGCGDDMKIYKEKLRSAYQRMEDGYNKFPLNIPGTSYSKALQARKDIKLLVADMIDLRKSTPTSSHDMLGKLMEEHLSSDVITDNVVGLIFAGQDTTASILTWAIKYLSDYPSLHMQVKDEQHSLRGKGKFDPIHLEFADIKKMLFTWQFLQETLRMSSVISFTFREAIEDFEYKNFLIPKGWKILPLFRNIHYNSEYYPDPLKFDPSRFEKPPKPNTYFPFGNGVHSCVGSELAKTGILIFIHHLVTGYKWRVQDPSQAVEYRPFLIPAEGLKIHLQKV